MARVRGCPVPCANQTLVDKSASLLRREGKCCKSYTMVCQQWQPFLDPPPGMEVAPDDPAEEEDHET